MLNNDTLIQVQGGACLRLDCTCLSMFQF